MLNLLVWNTHTTYKPFYFYGKTNIYAFGMVQKEVTINIIIGLINPTLNDNEIFVGNRLPWESQMVCHGISTQPCILCK